MIEKKEREKKGRKEIKKKLKNNVYAEKEKGRERKGKRKNWKRVETERK